MRLINQEEIHFILNGENPIGKLKSILVDLRKEGLNVSEIYDLLLDYYITLDEEDNGKIILGDFMDMITGYYKGKNLDLTDADMNSLI